MVIVEVDMNEELTRENLAIQVLCQYLWLSSKTVTAKV